jgi:hypothetical protein
VRVRLPGITPIELWDLLVDDVPLHERQTSGRLAAGLSALRAGEARTASGADLSRAIGWDMLFVGGGAPLDVAGAIRLPGGIFAGELGGRALLGRPGVIADLGQTSLKLSTPSGRTRIPRHGRRAREVLGGIDPDLLALPAALDEAGVPGPSTYPDLAALRPRGLVVNDAELMALSARRHPLFDPRRRTLVLTLGFGVGGAVCSPAGHA